LDGALLGVVGGEGTVGVGGGLGLVRREEKGRRGRWRRRRGGK